MFKSQNIPTISTPAKIAALYLALSLVYIYYSDAMVRLLSTDVGVVSRLQTIKGTVFVIISGGLLFFLVNDYSRKMTRYYTALVEERKMSEEKYMSVFNCSPLPMWIYDMSSLKFLLVNEAACRKYGYTKAEFYAMGINDIRPEEDMQGVLYAVKQVKGTTHKIWDTPYRHFCKNGTKLYVRIESAEIVYDGRVARLVTAMDVTDKMQAEEKLIEANERLNSASNIANLGYWNNDLLSSRIYWSDTLYDIFELDKRTFEPTMDNILCMFHEEDRHYFRGDLEDIIKEGTIKEFERRIVTGRGAEKWLLERITVRRNEDGTPVGLEGITLDVTERKNAQQALQNSNERFQIVAKAAHEAIIDWDIRSGEVFWGNGFLELFGYEPKTGDKLLWLRNIHADDRGRVLAKLRNALSNRNTEYFYDQFRFIKADGKIAFVEHRGIFIRDADGMPARAVGAMIDVTDVKEKIQRIEKQNEQLREIAWVQSHTVRGPLATLIGLTNLLKDKEQYNVDQAEIIDGIILSAGKLDDVIHDIVRRSETTDAAIRAHTS